MQLWPACLTIARLPGSRRQTIDLLSRLRSVLDRSRLGDPIFWSDDGLAFILNTEKQRCVSDLVGCSFSSFDDYLRCLSFHCREDPYFTNCVIYSHMLFAQGEPELIRLKLFAESGVGADDLALPAQSFSSALKPLEVMVHVEKRVFGDTACEVVVASSVINAVPDHVFANGYCLEASQDSALGSWTNEASQQSSISADDLTDVDILSQISAYYS